MNRRSRPPRSSTPTTWQRIARAVADRFSCPTEPPGSWCPPLPRWAWGLLLTTTVAVYANSLPNGFHYDDVSMIIENPAVQRIERLPNHFWQVTIGNQEGTPSYRPLVMASYALNYWWGKTNPAGYHVVNILLHALAAVLVVLLIWQWSVRATTAFFGGLVFALHPIQTEAVNYITARSSILYSVASLLAVLLYVRFRATGRVLVLAGSASAYAASLLAKEAAVVVPLLLIGYDVIIHRRGRSGILRWLRPHGLFIGITAVYLILRRMMMGEMMPAAYHSDLLTVALTFAAVVAKTLGGQLWPSDLSLAHAFSPVRRPNVDALKAVLVCVGLITVAALARRRAPLLAFAAIWFPISLLPVAALSLITTLALYQENRGYLSSIAIGLVAGPLLAWWWEALWARDRFIIMRRLTVAVLFAAMAVAVVARNPVWRNDVTLWSDVLKKAPGHQAAYVNLGAAYQALNDSEAAADVYRRALERFPNNAILHNNLGVIYRANGDLIRAAEEFRRAIRVRPGFATPHFNLALILQGAGAREEAVAAYRRFLELAPGQPGTAPNIPKAQQRLAELTKGGAASPPSPN